jgi:hypothetical protein
MKYKFILFFPGLLFSVMANAQVLFDRIDSTLKVGKAGYRVNCKNRNVDQNQLSIRPIGFESTAREMNFVLKGRVAKAEVDDLNSDGFPDLVLFIYSDSNATVGTVYVFVSDENKSIIPCILPDASLDGKINSGYKGHDKFSLMEGSLLQRFPLYKPGDDKDKPTGGSRVVQYQLARNESGGFKFNRIRFYDIQ